MKVWALFSIDNNYDQPDNNLEKLYKNKPTFEQLRYFFFKDTPIDEIHDNHIILLADILKGQESRFSNTDYRVEEVDVE